MQRSCDRLVKIKLTRSLGVSFCFVLLFRFSLSFLVVRPYYLLYTVCVSNFAFLQAISKELNIKFTKRRINNCNAYSLDKQFKPILRTTLHYYNTHHLELSKDQQISKLLAQVEDMKHVLGRNINLLLEREQKLDRLVNKSNQLKEETQVFKKRAQQVKKQESYKNYKYAALILFIIMIFIYLILATACNGVTLSGCKRSS